MRVVLDTNVLVRATQSHHGPARELLRAFETEEHVLVLSQFILAEVLRVLQYPRLQARHGLTTAECFEFVQLLHDLAEVVLLPANVDNVLVSDPDDNFVVQTAVTGQADALGTLDRHLRHPDVVDYCRRRQIAVLTDVELLQQLRDSTDDPVS
ncbi:MAG: putative toxin-antitoxin system toxin component, PIN family [Planctomycetaceae bacterium]